MSLLLFLASGAASTLLDIGLFAFLLHYLDSSVAYVASYSLCIVLRYAFDARMTFKADGYALRHFLLYFLTNAGLMLLGLLIFHVLTLGMNDIYAKVISIPPVTLAGFLLMRHFVFAGKRQPEAAGSSAASGKEEN